MAECCLPHRESVRPHRPIADSHNVLPMHCLLLVCRPPHSIAMAAYALRRKVGSPTPLASKPPSAASTWPLT